MLVLKKGKDRVPFDRPPGTMDRAARSAEIQGKAEDMSLLAISEGECDGAPGLRARHDVAGLIQPIGTRLPVSDSPAGTVIRARAASRAAENLSGATAILLVIILGAVVRLWFAVEHPMRYDEAYNYLHFASKSPAYVATHYLPNNHVLHTLMVRVSIALCGPEPWALRLPALVGGILLIPATAWLGWTVSRNRWAAVLAGLAVCVSSPLIEYSANARGYSWLALFAVLTTALSIRLALGPSSLRRWLAWGVLGAMGTYTLPIMAYPLAGQIAGLIAIHRIGLSRNPTKPRSASTPARHALGGLGLLVGATITVYSPILIMEGTSGFRRGTSMAYEILGAHVGSYAGMISGAWALWTRHTPFFWPWILAGGCCLFLVSAVRQFRAERLIPAATIAGALAAATLMAAPLPPRAWLFGLPIVLACAATGLGDLITARSGQFGQTRFGQVVCHARSLGAPTQAFPSRDRKGAVDAIRDWGPDAPLCRILGGGCLAVAFALPLIQVCRETRLVAEVCGLVEVREALEECRRFGPARCAIVSRYTPATAYYASILATPSPSLAGAAGIERVYIIVETQHGIDEQWDVAKFQDFGPVEQWLQLPWGTVFVADRRSP